MSKQTPSWLTTELEWGLHETSAPAELWDRVMAARRVEPVRRRGVFPTLAWALSAAALLMIAIGLGPANRRGAGSDPALALGALHGTSRVSGLRCQNPAELRAWVRADSDIRNSLQDRAGERRFTLASNTSGDLQISCKLCHLD